MSDNNTLPEETKIALSKIVEKVEALEKDLIELKQKQQIDGYRIQALENELKEIKNKISDLLTGQEKISQMFSDFKEYTNKDIMETNELVKDINNVIQTWKGKGMVIKGTLGVIIFIVIEQLISKFLF